MEDSISAEVKAPENSSYLQHTQALVASYAANSKAANTWKAYQADLRDFAAWYDTYSLASLPATPETVAAYLANLAQQCKISTIQRWLSAINQRHAVAGFDSSTRSVIVRLTMQGIRRTHALA